ncbi:hypothetical protein CT0861_05978 [Colletotrichum tofieldiae]|uniref:Uncharacterized protein n=1 Tax=Colletotrichum tofieldiae TaxID=708197 RepID=A0A166NSU8_9PEZI|nr:hypothetical protein CT0861_05978 [Colletotrichum tofieldiae]GKT92781.1 hypothetical protein Ct61P_10631 [Colletotrichum tofieldiae]
MSSTDGYAGGPFWTEHEINPAPEVMVHSAPEAVEIPMNNMVTGNDGAYDERLVHTGGDIAAPGDTEQTGRSKVERRSRLWNWRTIIAICVGLLILAIVIPVVVAVTAANQGYSRGSIETTATSLSSSASASSVTSAPSSVIPYPSSTLDPPPECVKSKFVKAVNWIGIDQVMGGWDFNLHPANTAEECCTICHQSTRDGCNGWLYMAEESFTPACSIIHGFAGPRKNGSCPEGHPGIVFAKTDDTDNYGGPGPCAGSVRE